MTPKRKRAKTSPADDDGPLDRETWPGWCEMESEPAYFNVMLRELGVRGIKIRELFSLDEQISDHLPSALALIFLFQYRDTDERETAQQCPRHVWFANQVPDFSCASVALMNIVNNVERAILGPQLDSFRAFTEDMSPIDRGYAIADFQFLRRTHNSFARELELQNANIHIKQKHETKLANDRAKARAKAREEKQAQKPNTDANNGANGNAGVRRSTRKSKPVERLLDDVAVGDTDLDTESGFHFIAYMPIGGNAWVMDGMENAPRDMGRVEGNDWLNIVRPSIMERMTKYAQGQITFNLMAAVKDPYDEAFDLLRGGTRRGSQQTEIETHKDPLNSDEGKTSTAEVNVDRTFPEDQTPVAKSVLSTNAEDMARLRTIVSDEGENRALDERKALLRRHDFRQFFSAWVNALKEADVLDTLAAHVKVGT